MVDWLVDEKAVLWVVLLVVEKVDPKVALSAGAMVVN